MSNAEAAPKGRPPLTGRTITLTLTIPRVISLVLFAVVAIVWFFVMGLIIGRGYEPEKHIPALAEIMPGKDNTAPPSVVHNGSAPALKEGEQKGKAVQPVQKPTTSQTNATKTRASINEADKAHREQVKATAQKPPATPPQKEQGKNEPDKQTPKQERFEYVYQAASFKQADQAEALAKKLTTGGIPARVNAFTSGNTRWHRVLITFRGTPDDTETLRKDLERFKIKKILLVTKKPFKQ